MLNKLTYMTLFALCSIVSVQSEEVRAPACGCPYQSEAKEDAVPLASCPCRNQDKEKKSGNEVLPVITSCKNCS